MYGRLPATVQPGTRPLSPLSVRFTARGGRLVTAAHATLTRPALTLAVNSWLPGDVTVHDRPRAEAGKRSSRSPVPATAGTSDVTCREDKHRSHCDSGACRSPDRRSHRERSGTATSTSSSDTRDRGRCAQSSRSPQRDGSTRPAARSPPRVDDRLQSSKPAGSASERGGSVRSASPIPSTSSGYTGRGEVLRSDREGCAPHDPTTTPYVPGTVLGPARTYAQVDGEDREGCRCSPFLGGRFSEYALVRRA